MPETDRRYRSFYRAAARACVIGWFLFGMGDRVCFAEAPGVSVISLPKAKIVITERACGPRHCGVSGPGVEPPQTEVTSIVAEIGDKTHHRKYSLPCKGMFDAWGGGLDENVRSKNRRFGATCYDENNCVLRGVFADGAETFVAQWEISDGRVSRTVFTGVSDIVDLFMSNIDPPGNVYD